MRPGQKPTPFVPVGRQDLWRRRRRRFQQMGSWTSAGGRVARLPALSCGTARHRRGPGLVGKTRARRRRRTAREVMTSTATAPASRPASCAWALLTGQGYHRGSRGSASPLCAGGGLCGGRSGAQAGERRGVAPSAGRLVAALRCCRQGLAGKREVLGQRHEARPGGWCS